MASIVHQRVGDKIYLYESTSYRNAEGKPRNKRVPIGKIDPTTGQPVYKPEFLARMEAVGAILEVAAAQSFTADDIRRSSVLEFGAMYLLQSIAQQVGILNALQSALPSNYQEIFTLACYLVTSGDHFLYCEEWMSKTSCPDDIGSLSSQRISDLLQAITPGQREAFYQTWCELRCEQEYLALDMTSTSSYSELIQDVEWGYNRDKEQLAQINICMLMGETSLRAVTKERAWNENHRLYTHVYYHAMYMATIESTLVATKFRQGGDKKIRTTSVECCKCEQTTRR